jgi:hypothetical protein
MRLRKYNDSTLRKLHVTECYPGPPVWWALVNVVTDLISYKNWNPLNIWVSHVLRRWSSFMKQLHCSRSLYKHIKTLTSYFEKIIREASLQRSKTTRTSFCSDRESKSRPGGPMSDLLIFVTLYGIPFYYAPVCMTHDERYCDKTNMSPLERGTRSFILKQICLLNTVQYAE